LGSSFHEPLQHSWLQVCREAKQIADEPALNALHQIARYRREAEELPISIRLTLWWIKVKASEWKAANNYPGRSRQGEIPRSSTLTLTRERLAHCSATIARTKSPDITVRLRGRG
jgi:hypothetical protein